MTRTLQAAQDVRAPSASPIESTIVATVGTYSAMIAQANKYVFEKIQSLPVLSFRQTCPDTRSPSVCARDALQNWARNDPGPWVNLTPVSRQRFAGIVLIQTHPDRRDLPAFGTSKCIDPIQRDIPIYDRLFHCSL